MKTTSRINIHRVRSLVAPIANLAAPTVALFLCATAWPALAEPEAGHRAPELQVGRMYPQATTTR